MTGSYFLQSSVAKPTHAPHVKCQTLEIGSYFMQNSVTRFTREPHVKSRTLKIKPHVHIIKFYRID